MRISVVVPVFNEQSTIRDLLLSLDRLDYPRRDMEVLIVDNGSSDHTREIVKQFRYRLLVESTKRTSYAARNLGISHSTGNIIAFTDADCIVSSSWLRDLARGFSDPKVGGVAGPIISLEPVTLIEKLQAWLSVPNHNSNLLPHPFAVTANVAYRRVVFKKIGMFEERFATSSDVDFAIRMQKVGGFELRFLSDTGIVFHRNDRNFFDLLARAKRYGGGHSLLLRKHPDAFPTSTIVQTIGKASRRVSRELVSADRLRDFFLVVTLESLRFMWQFCFELGVIEGRRSEFRKIASANV